MFRLVEHYLSINFLTCCERKKKLATVLQIINLPDPSFKACLHNMELMLHIKSSARLWKNEIC